MAWINCGLDSFWFGLIVAWVVLHFSQLTFVQCSIVPMFSCHSCSIIYSQLPTVQLAYCSSRNWNYFFSYVQKTAGTVELFVPVPPLGGCAEAPNLMGLKKIFFAYSM